MRNLFIENTLGAELSIFTFSCIINAENCKPHLQAGVRRSQLVSPRRERGVKKRTLPILPGKKWPRSSKPRGRLKMPLINHPSVQQLLLLRAGIKS